ncbi:MAG: mechanosensitive ion channel family protein [Oscillospiraceae bacterium]|nr:mechanosensitive ion channel family protein [Oscillospiraceae bacterium]
MKGISTKRNVVKLIIAVVIIAICAAAGIFTGIFTDKTSWEEVFKNVPAKLLRLVLMIAFMIALNAVLQLIIQAIKSKRKRTQTLTTVIASLIKYVIVIAAIIWALTIFGVNVGTIFAGVGILALVLGFGAESLVSDLVTGAFILFENQYNVGDIVELDGYRGTVDFVGIRTTGIRDVGGNVKIINNSDIKNIINRSERSSVAVTTVGIHYSQNLSEVEKKLPDILHTIKERNSDVFIGSVNYLGVEELSDSSVNLKFTAEVEESNIFTGRRLLNREIKVLFDEAGIEIAFPQMDVHMK